MQIKIAFTLEINLKMYYNILNSQKSEEKDRKI